MKEVLILMGVPGSGKSTFAERTYPLAEVFSADKHFMVDRKYQFDPSKLGEAHGACLRSFVEAVRGEWSYDRAIVDNTNTTLAEIAPYYSIAKAWGCSVEIVHIKCDWAKAAARNKHGVPEGVVRGMAARIKKTLAAGFPSFWEVAVRHVNAE